MTEDEQSKPLGRRFVDYNRVGKPIGFRPTPEQREWIEKEANDRHLTISEFIRLQLVMKGMPV